MSRIKTHVKKGDHVQVISGAFKGATGTILEVQPGKGRVTIEGVATIKKTVRPSQKNTQGGFIDIQRPIHISNVKLADAPEKKTTAKKAAKKAATKTAKKSVEKKS
jgi:large subunit ribosomal protein L24